VIKRLTIILPLLLALLSFKVSASVLVLTGGYVSAETNLSEEKENAIHHWSDNEKKSAFEEFIEEQEEEEDSEFSIGIQFSFFSTTQTAFSSSRLVKCRKVKRKLFMLYKSYKFDCCKF
jgi:hypothetical protein